MVFNSTFSVDLMLLFCGIFIDYLSALDVVKKKGKHVIFPPLKKCTNNNIQSNKTRITANDMVTPYGPYHSISLHVTWSDNFQQ